MREASPIRQIHQSNITMVKIEQTKWGCILHWGTNCTTNVQSIRKMNECFSKHPKMYDDYCNRCDNLGKLITEIVSELDAICNEGDGIWPHERQERYDDANYRLEKASIMLDELTFGGYPQYCVDNGFGYCC